MMMKTHISGHMTRSFASKDLSQKDLFLGNAPDDMYWQLLFYLKGGLGLFRHKG